MSEYAIGVDLGGTNLRVAAVGAEGRILAQTTRATDVARGRDAVIDELCQASHEVIERMRREDGARALRGLGIGCAGIIDSETGRLVDSPNLPGWNDYDVKGEIERRLATPVLLENDANCAALGEQWLGAGRELAASGDKTSGAESEPTSLCLYTLGTGVGGGIILNGRIWRGANGMAGELGHVTIEPDGAPCACGNRGCLERYASATAVMRLAREAIAAGTRTALREIAPAQLTAHAVFDCAQAGDGAAKKIFAIVGRALGVAIAGLINTLNVPLYVIGGGVSAAWPAFAPTLFAEVQQRSFVYAGTTTFSAQSAGVIVQQGRGGRRRFTRIVRARLGGDAGIYGAARLPLLP